jgi:glycosyltransferase involved in cell wall biosynthesis/predicted metal-dependent phosphoesterase TrpH
MARVDLHVHTRYSDHPSEWFLQRLGASESYTEPENVYHIAKSRGMDFVAITDHNTIKGALELKARHPEDVIVGVELTTYFPDDGCKVHVLVWGITEEQFAQLDAARKDIYVLREYLRAWNLAHAVAHATYSVNGRLTVEHLERLLVLFDSFETLNGSRTARQNAQWSTALECVTPSMIADLARAHRIAPRPGQPWVKGATAGSDDHSGLLIGRAWTEAEADTPDAFLQAIRDRHTRAVGRNNDYRALAFSVYKIALDYARSNAMLSQNPLVERLHQLLYGIAQPASAPAAISRLIAQLRAVRDPLGARLLSVCEDLERMCDADLDERFDVAYEHAARAIDELLGSLLRSAETAVSRGELAAVVAEASTALSTAFVAAPFFTTLGALSRGRGASDEFVRRHALGPSSVRRVLWFTDTLTDLNGVSVTLQQVARTAAERGDALGVVTCGCADAMRLTGTIVDLPSVHTFHLPYYESYVLGVPSPLRALRTIQSFEPDAIMVSTPGPVGMLGLAVARLLDVPCTFVYHTDYGAQLSHVGGEDSPAELVDDFVHWVCRQCDAILVPSQAYRARLEQVGIVPDRIRDFRRGIDTAAFAPGRSGRAWLTSHHGVPDAPTLLYTGRVSREKALDTLLEAYERLLEEHPDLNLVIAGDGPYLGELRTAWSHLAGVHWLGSLPNSDLPPVYSAADIFCFPSRTDTFGMSVLEAQACGVPAVVSDAGGPQDIVVDGVTGTVVPGPGVDAWVDAIDHMLVMAEDRPVDYLRMTLAARARATMFDWNVFLDEITTGDPGGPATPGRCGGLPVEAVRRGEGLGD